jgi:hypothetical protein
LRYVANTEVLQELRETPLARSRQEPFRTRKASQFQGLQRWNRIRREGRKGWHAISGHQVDAVFSRYNILSKVDIARKIEEGAKAAVRGSIHGSFIVEPETKAEERAQNDGKSS